MGQGATSHRKCFLSLASDDKPCATTLELEVRRSAHTQIQIEIWLDYVSPKSIHTCTEHMHEDTAAKQSKSLMHILFRVIYASARKAAIAFFVGYLFVHVDFSVFM